jgi:hypothetical protein
MFPVERSGKGEHISIKCNVTEVCSFVVAAVVVVVVVYNVTA